MVAGANWCIKVDDKIYGPYTSDQMRKYAHEGRLAAFSLIAPAGSRAWREARSEGSFSNFFGYEAPRRGSKPARVFGRKDSDCDAPAPTGKSRAVETTANFVLIFDPDSGAANRLETAIHSLGRAFRIAENVWTLNCDLTAVGVRNAIAPYLPASEPIFVVDASRGRTSWQNYAPEMHAKISAAFTVASSARAVA